MTGYLSLVMKNYVASYSGLNRSCWQGIILNFIESTLIGIYYFLPLYFVNILNIDLSIAGIIISFYGIGAIFGGFLGGKLSDKFSPSIVSIISLLLQALVLIALMQHTTPHLLIIDVFFMGVASYGFVTSIHLWTLNQCNSEYSKLQAINILNVASNLGLAISAIVVSSFANCGFRIIFAISSFILFISAIHFALLKSSKITLKLDKEPNISKVIAPKKMTVNIVLICLFLIGLIIFQSGITYPIYIKATYPEYGIKGVGILFALNCVLVIMFQNPIVTYFSGHNKIRTVGAGAFLIGFGMFILNFSKLFIIAILGCIINTFGEILFFSVAQYICYQSAAENNKGRSLGIYRMIYACSRIFAPALGGYIYQQYGSHTLWSLCGLIGLFCILLCALHNEN